VIRTARRSSEQRAVRIIRNGGPFRLRPPLVVSPRRSFAGGRSFLVSHFLFFEPLRQFLQCGIADLVADHGEHLVLFFFDMMFDILH
jgi:hypothetical protein